MAEETPDSDFPTRIADLLENTAKRIRSYTVDRVARVITFITLGLVAITLVGIAFVFFLIGIFRIVGELIHRACGCAESMELAYAAVGGVFLAVGALAWSRRKRGETSA